MTNTIKDSILLSLENLKVPSTHREIYQNIVDKKYYEFVVGKTPEATISAQLGDFIRRGDKRVKRIKNGKLFRYFLSKYEVDINIENEILLDESQTNDCHLSKAEIYLERDLHKLLSSYLKSQQIYAKTIFHEHSKNGNDNHQKWIHPDMIGISFLELKSKVNQAFIKVLNKTDTFKIYSYELKREINTDYELKKFYFQAVSNSSWANYGYLVAFEISDNLMDEIERLNQSFGIGVIELKSNPYESNVLFPAQYKELDFKTIDKLCKVNDDFEKFIDQTEKILTAPDKYVKTTENEFDNFCDNYFKNDAEIKEYCDLKNIPFDMDDIV